MNDQLTHILHTLFAFALAFYTGWVFGRLGFRGVWRIVTGWFVSAFHVLTGK